MTSFFGVESSEEEKIKCMCSRLGLSAPRASVDVFASLWHIDLLKSHCLTLIIIIISLAIIPMFHEGASFLAIRLNLLVWIIFCLPSITSK